MKKLLNFFAILTFCVSLFGLSVFGIDVSKIEYTVNEDDNTATITGYKGTQSGNLTIPSRIDGYRVTAIGDSAFKNCDGFTGKLVIPTSVKTIGGSAFYACTNLTGTLNIPSSVTEVGSYAFAFCRGLTGDIVVPGSIKTIADRTFSGCTGFNGSVIIKEGITKIGKYAFADCTGFTGNLSLPSTLTSIGVYAFQGSKGFTGDLVILANYTAIESYAFCGCQGFSRLIIEDGVRVIGQNAFYQSTFGEVHIPQSMKTVNKNAFANNYNLTKAYFYGNKPTVYDNSFRITAAFTAYFIDGKTGWKTPTVSFGLKSVNTSTFNPLDIVFDENVISKDSLENQNGESNVISIKIVDAKDKSAISGADVTLNGISVTTGSDGVAKFDKPDVKTASLTVSASGYASVNCKNYSAYTGSSREVFEMYKISDIDIIPVTCNGKSLSTSSVKINNKADLVADIVISSTVDEQDMKYTLTQNHAVIAESTTGEFKIHNSVFKKNSPIVASLFVNGEAVASKVINISVVSFSFVPVSFPLGAEKIKVPADVSVFGGMEFELESEEQRVVCEITNDELKVGYNLDVVDKDLSKLNEGLRNWMEANKRKTPYANLTFSVGGYAVVEMGNNGPSNIDGQIVIALKYENGVGKTFVALVPVRVEFEFSLEGEIEITAIGYDFDNAKFVFPSLDSEITGELTALAGIGCSLASVGVYGSATLELALKLLPEFTVDSLIASGKFGVYAKVKFVGSTKVPVFTGDLVLYDKDRADLSAYSLYDTSSVYNEMMYSLERSTASAWNSSVVDGILQTNVSGFADPKIAKIGDNVVAVYLADDVTLDEHNSQQLVYSVFNGSGWSEPVSVNTNALADGEYSLYSDGTNIYLAYTEAKRTLTADDDATAKASAIEVVVCKFDSTNKIFTEHTAITNDTYFDTHPAVSVVNGIPTVAFVKNTDNNIFGMSENNDLYVCQYIDGEWVTSTVSTKTNAVTSLALGSFDDKSYVVAGVHDSDNNFETTEDRYVSLYTFDGQNVSTAIGSYDNAVFEGNTLYWYSSNAVYKTNSFSNIGTLVTDAISQDFAPDFDVLEDGSLLFRVYNAENENGGADLYVVKENTLPVRITETGGYIDSFDALTVDGSILTLCRTTEVTYFDEYGFETVSNLESKYIECFEKIEITDVAYEKTDLFDGDTLTLTITLKNSGMLDANGFTLNVNGVSTNYSDILKSGETKEIVYICTLPETPDTLAVCTFDSEMTVDVGYADFAVSAEDKIVAEDMHLYVTLTNEGNIKGEGTLTIKRDDENGAEIYSETLELGAGEQKYIMLEIIDDTLTKAYIVFTPEEADYYDGDNSTYCELVPTAELPEEVPLYTYTVNADNKTATITGYVGPVDEDIDVPSEIDGYTVTVIGEKAFYERTDLTGKLTIPDSVTTIGISAFYNCYKLKGDLIIPDSVITICDSAFVYCYGFNGELVLGNNVETIGNYAFRYCNSLKGDLVIPDSVTTMGEQAFRYCYGFDGNLIIGKGLTSIGDDAFYNCGGLVGNLVIPDNVTSIGKQAFGSCSGFSGNLVIGNGVTTIGDAAFKDCSGFMGNLVMGSNVNKIGESAFSGCSNLKGEFTLKDTVSAVGNSAFHNCYSIEKMTVYGENTTFGSGIFYNVNSKFEIHGYTGSTAEAYANANNHTFVALDETVTVSISFAGKLSAFMDTLYIRYYFNTNATEGIDYMGTLLMSADDFTNGGYTELTLDNATTNLVANNSADDQYATLGKFALQTVYAKDINVVYKVRPYIVMTDGSIFYGETEDYGMGIYLNNQINKDTSTAVYKEVLAALINYGSAMEAYANR